MRLCSLKSYAITTHTICPHFAALPLFGRQYYYALMPPSCLQLTLYFLAWPHTRALPMLLRYLPAEKEVEEEDPYTALHYHF